MVYNIMKVESVMELIRNCLSFKVLVNRLSWQRVWSLSPPADGNRVRGLAWRPDGKGDQKILDYCGPFEEKKLHWFSIMALKILSIR